MPDDGFESTIDTDLSAVDRRAVLLEAADLLDQRRGVLGKGGKYPKTREGNMVRAFADDEAKLGAKLDVYEITDKDFLGSQKKEVPVKFSQWSKNFRFYWIRFPVGLFPRANWAFNRLEVRIEFTASGAAHTLPTAYQILPDKKFETYLKGGMDMQLVLDENFQFKAVTGSLQKQVGKARAKLQAGVDVKVAPKLGFVAGPFDYRIGKVTIDNSGTGLEWVAWRLDGAKFFQQNTPDLIVISQVPKEAQEVKVQARLKAARYFNYLPAPLQDAVKQLAGRLFKRFKDGLPITDEKSYDLAPVL